MSRSKTKSKTRSTHKKTTSTKRTSKSKTRSGLSKETIVTDSLKINNLLKQLHKEDIGPKSEKEKMKQQVEDIALNIMITVAREGEGGLIVIGKLNKDDYECHYPNFFERRRFTVFDDGIKPVLEKLATIDGAIVIDEDGRIRAYGARILRQKAYRGHGTRHSAAKGISLTGATAILASEEDHLVRIFKNGQVVVEINPFTKGIEKHTTKIIKLLHSPEVAGILAGAAAAPLVGIPVLSGVIIFSGSYMVSKKILDMIKSIEFK